MRSLGRVVGCLTAMVLLASLAAWSLQQERKGTARQYREIYREQGRAQVIAEAIEAGVAQIVDGRLVWATNDVVIAEREIHELLINELIRRRDAKENKEKEESSSKGKGKSGEEEWGEKQEASSELGDGRLGEGDGEGEAGKGSSEEGQGRGSIQGAEEEGSSSKPEEE